MNGSKPKEVRMTDRPNGEGENPLRTRHTSPYRSRHEALDEWLRENVRHYEAKEQITLFGFNVSFVWDSDTCGSFYVKFDGDPCPDAFQIFYAMNGTPDFRGPICHSPVGVPATYATVEFSYAAGKAIRSGLSAALPRAKPFGRDSQTGEMVNIGTPLGKRLPPQSEIETVEKKLSAPFFFVEIPIEATGV